MTKNEKIQQLIFNVIDEINLELPREKQLEKSVDTVLYGETGTLDSMGLVNLIVAIEKKVEEELEVAITIASEKAISMNNSPFRTIGTITDYVASLLENNE